MSCFCCLIIVQYRVSPLPCQKALNSLFPPLTETLTALGGVEGTFVKRLLYVFSPVVLKITAIWVKKVKSCRYKSVLMTVSIFVQPHIKLIDNSECSLFLTLEIFLQPFKVDSTKTDLLTENLIKTNKLELQQINFHNQQLYLITDQTFESTFMQKVPNNCCYQLLNVIILYSSCFVLL